MGSGLFGGSEQVAAQKVVTPATQKQAETVESADKKEKRTGISGTYNRFASADENSSGTSTTLG